MSPHPPFLKEEQRVIFHPPGTDAAYFLLDVVVSFFPPGKGVPLFYRV